MSKPPLFLFSTFKRKLLLQGALLGDDKTYQTGTFNTRKPALEYRIGTNHQDSGKKQQDSRRKQEHLIYSLVSLLIEITGISDRGLP
jgi:hypothetical protein|tara:strand:+ start:1857 stop:2117 length:261 start_codon:yes stop_codon:yes gene_type:complete